MPQTIVPFLNSDFIRKWKKLFSKIGIKSRKLNLKLHFPKMIKILIHVMRKSNLDPFQITFYKLNPY